MDEGGSKVFIDWGKYGKYELEVNTADNTMNGCKLGEPSNWRRARYIRELGPEAIATAPAHDHSHKHGEHCDHDH
jgi:hypothetical protein